MFEHCCLDGHIGECIIGFVDVGREEFGGISGLFDAVDPDLDVLVLVAHYLVRVRVHDRLEGK